MTSQAWLQIGTTLLIGFVISIPVGRYLATLVTGRKTVFDRLLDPIDNFIYVLIGRRTCGQAMDWKAYTLHMLATNLVMALIIFLILVFQDRLPLNPMAHSRNNRCKRPRRSRITLRSPPRRSPRLRRRRAR